MEVTQSLKDRRREVNRASAHKRYHKKQELLQQLRSEAAELDKRVNADLLRSSSNKSDGDSSATEIKTLKKENAALHERLDWFLYHEHRLNLVQMGRYAQTPRQENSSGPCIILKKPMTAEECNAIVCKIRPEIATFSASGREGSISTGASVFGWTDQRRVDNGVLKFSLSKLYTMYSPEEASAGIWELLTSPDGFNKIVSESLNLHSEIVQVVDHCNVVIYQERHVHNSTCGVPVITVVRALVLLTLFATESGYIYANYGLDQALVMYEPDRYLIPVPGQNEIVQETWQPMSCWMTFDRVEEAPDHCLVSFVGAFPAELSIFVSWAVEVLLIVLRIERLHRGPQWILPQEEDKTQSPQASSCMVSTSSDNE